MPRERMTTADRAPAVVLFPRGVPAGPPTSAPELVAFLNCVRFLHECESTAFYCMARLVANTASDRGGPGRDLKALRAFIAEWEKD